MRRAVFAAVLAASLAMPAIVLAAGPDWNLVGSYKVDFVCLTGDCAGSTFTNSMTISSSNDVTGAVAGSGSVDGFTGFDWTMTGTVAGSGVTFVVTWVSPPSMLSYNPMNMTGSIDSSGGMSGTASDASRTFTWSTTSGKATPIATHLVVTATSPQTAGAAFSVTVTAKDVNNNTASGYTGTVHFSSTDGAATLPADYTFVVGDAGVHTFTNGVTLNTTGGQTLTATDTVRTSVTGTSATITVNAPVPPPPPPPYAVPTITTISPLAGKVGATVTLLGTSFNYARGVTINGVPASFSVRSPSVIVATVPVGARTGVIRVTTPFGTATSARTFFVLP